MKLTLFGLPNCSTCRKARAWLDERGFDHQFVDYRAQPLAPTDLKQWQQDLGGWPKLVNRASMTWRKLPDDRKTPPDDRQWLALIEEYPALVRRPVVWDGREVSVGFSEKKFAARFDA